MTVTANSLQGRLAQFRTDAEAEHPIDLDVPGYHGVLVARYRPVGWRLAVKLDERHATVKDPAERTLLRSADLLLNSCMTLLERKDDETLEDLDLRWGSEAAKELFGLEVPEKATARQALLTIFEGEKRQGLLVEHAGDLIIQSRTETPKVDGKTEGESEPSVEGSPTSQLTLS